jgi:hypothetical protein
MIGLINKYGLFKEYDKKHSIYDKNNFEYNIEIKKQDIKKKANKETNIETQGILEKI